MAQPYATPAQVRELPSPALRCAPGTLSLKRRGTASIPDSDSKEA